MAYTSIEETIVAVLVAQWGLGAPLSTAEVKFFTGWYNPDYKEHPQVVVSHSYPARDIEWFGEITGDTKLHYISREIFVINCWCHIPAGADAPDEDDPMEQMRKEVFRICKEQWNAYAAPFGAVLPRDRGRYIPDFDKTPRLERVELEIQVNIRE